MKEREKGKEGEDEEKEEAAGETGVKKCKYQQ